MLNKTLDWNLTKEESLIVKLKEELLSKMKQILEMNKEIKNKEKLEKSKKKEQKAEKKKAEKKKHKKKHKKSKSIFPKFLQKNAGIIIFFSTCLVAIALFCTYEKSNKM